MNLNRCSVCDDVDDSYPCFFGCGNYCAGCYREHYQTKCRGPVHRPSWWARAMAKLVGWIS